MPHVFTSTPQAGIHLHVPMVCADYRAFPTLGWLDMHAVFPGHVTALAMVLLGGGLGISNSGLRSRRLRSRRLRSRSKLLLSLIKKYERHKPLAARRTRR